MIVDRLARRVDRLHGVEDGLLPLAGEVVGADALDPPAAHQKVAENEPLGLLVLRECLFRLWRSLCLLWSTRHR